MPACSSSDTAPHTADRARRPVRSASGSLRPIAAEAFGYEQARHLLWRAGFGGTPAQIQTLVAWGPERSVDYLIDYQGVPYDAPRAEGFDKDIMRPYSADERRQAAAARRSRDENALAQLRAERQRRQREDRAQIRTIQRWWLERMIETPRPLEEKLTLFWHGHFAPSYRTIEDSYHMYRQNQLFRAHAAGSYAELLHQIIRDPAMLAYLDNDDSRKGAPNENLAREIMELFALGVGNYTERDIKEGARALTGYTFVDDDFVFNEGNHDRGSKRILGASGSLDGDGFVNAILTQKACSRFIAAKLYDFFCRDTPSVRDDQDENTRRVVDRLADELAGHKYDVGKTLRTLFLSEHFYEPGVMGEKIKSPAVLLVGAIRSLGTPVRDLSVLVDAMNLMGQNIFYPPSVKGWDGRRSWINTSTLFVRQNALAFLLTGRTPVGYDPLSNEESYDPGSLLAPLASADPAAARDPQRVVDYLLRFTVGGTPQHAVDTLNAFASEHRGDVTNPAVVTGMLLLATALPEYQLC